MADILDNSIHIRLARDEDAGLIHAGLMKIAVHLGAEGKVTSTVEDIRRHGFGVRPAFEVLIAEAKHPSPLWGGVGEEASAPPVFAGMCLFFPSFSTWRGERGAYIQDIVVDEWFRGSGIGIALIRHTATHVREQGGTYLRLSVDEKNVSAQHFYERLGLAWSREERIHAAYGDAFQVLAGLHESGV